MEDPKRKCQNLGCKRIATSIFIQDQRADLALYANGSDDETMIENYKPIYLYLCEQCNAHIRPGDLEENDIPYY